MQCSQCYYRFILYLPHQFPLNFISPALQLIFLHCLQIGCLQESRGAEDSICRKKRYLEELACRSSTTTEFLEQNDVHSSGKLQQQQREMTDPKCASEEAGVSRNTERAVMNLCVSLTLEVPKNHLISLDDSYDQKFQYKPNKQMQVKDIILRSWVSLLKPNVSISVVNPEPFL